MAGRIYRWAVPIKPHQHGYIPMREAIRKAIIEQHTNPKAVAESVGLNRFFIYNYLAGDKDEVESTKIAKVLKSLHLPLELLTGDVSPTQRRKAVKPGKLLLMGIVEAGAFREPFEPEPCDIPPIEGWPAEKQSVFLVSGMDFPRIATAGDFLIVADDGSMILEGAYVVTKKERSGLVQYGLSQVHIEGDQVELWPMTQSPLKGMTPITFQIGQPKNIVGVLLRAVKVKH